MTYTDTHSRERRSPGPVRRVRSSRAFTLVEILIVVIILGILAAIVIPQFTSASQDARRSSLISQLQTLRSQIHLYAIQHRDQYPPSLLAGGADAWSDMLVRTNVDHTTAGSPVLGPYLVNAPANHLNGSVAVDATIAVDFGSGGVTNPGATTAGWLFNPSTGKLWATSTRGGYVYNEADPQDVNNADR